MTNYSFIIPHHNSPELLNRCLASIPERDDIQIIVVDDNSKEDKKPCIERQGVEIIYIDAQHTKGAGRARNVGMAKATGEWLLFADCDDYYEEGFLDVLDKYKDKDIDVLYFNFNHVDRTYILPANKLQKTIAAFTGDKEEIDFIKFRNNSPWSKMVKRVYIVEHKMFFEEVPNGNDVLFSLFIAAFTKKIKITDSYIYNYHVTPNSIVRKKRTAEELLCTIDHIIKHNQFNIYINHSEWNMSIIKYLLSIMRKYKIQIVPLLIPTLLHSWNKEIKNEWVQIIDNHK